MCKGKKYTKTQPKKIVCGIGNFGSTKLIKSKKKYIKTQQNDAILS